MDGEYIWIWSKKPKLDILSWRKFHFIDDVMKHAKTYASVIISRESLSKQYNVYSKNAYWNISQIWQGGTKSIPIYRDCQKHEQKKISF